MSLLFLEALTRDEKLRSEAIGLDQIHGINEFLLVGARLKLDLIAAPREPLIIPGKGQGPQQIDNNRDRGDQANAAGDQKQDEDQEVPHWQRFDHHVVATTVPVRHLVYEFAEYAGLAGE